MSRLGRYSSKSTQQPDFQSEKELLLPKLQNDFNDFQNKKIHPAQVVGNYILEVTRFRKGQTWKGSHFHWVSCFNADPFLDFWGQELLRSLPWKVNYVLINWYLGYFPLKLVNFIPSAYQMLQLQAENERYVTIFTDANFWSGEIIHHRDHLSFVVHDLIHAFEFFYHDYLRKAQVDFYKMLLNHFERLSNSENFPNFKSNLEYLISDMNSHPKHLESYFDWLVAEHQISL